MSRVKNRDHLLEVDAHIQPAPSTSAVKLATDATKLLHSKWQFSLVKQLREQRYSTGTTQRDALESEVIYALRAFVKAKQFEQFEALAQRRIVLLDDAALAGWPVANFLLRRGRHGLETDAEFVQLMIEYEKHKEAEDTRVRQETQQKSIDQTLKAIGAQAKASSSKGGGRRGKGSSAGSTPVAARTREAQERSALARASSFPGLPLSSQEEGKSE
jgi:hypothetical protein